MPSPFQPNPDINQPRVHSNATHAAVRQSARNNFARSRPRQSAEPTPRREIEGQIKLQDEPAQGGHGCHPKKAAPKECQSSDVSEEEITQPAAPDIFPGK